MIINIIILIIPLSNTIIIRANPVEWWSANWKFRKPIIINQAFISSNLFNFPLLVNITDANLIDNVHGGNIIFTDVENNKLSHELVRFNNSNGCLVAWVRVPEIFSSEDTILYIYYGNQESSSQEDPFGVWDANYVLVLHLDEEEGLALDSTSNGNSGIPHNIVRRGVQGVIDDAYDFYHNYESGYLEIVNGEGILSEKFTASLWLKLDDVLHNQGLFGKFDTSMRQISWFIGYKLGTEFTTSIAFHASVDGRETENWDAPLEASVEEWFYLTVVWEPDSIPKIYVNGVMVTSSKSSTISAIHNNTLPIIIGKSPFPEYIELDGLLDEIRLSDSARSPDWILAEYNNQHDPAGFISIGEEEPQPGSPIIFDPFPVDRVIVSGESIELNFSLMDYQGDLMDFNVSTHPDIGKASFVNVSNGVYSIQLSGFEYYKIHEWKIEVTDGVNTISKVYKFTPVHFGDDIILPRADAGPDVTIDEDQQFVFDGSNSTDNIGVSNYTWTLWDEGPQMLKGAKPTYNFTKPGTYKVVLIVTDFSGNPNTDFLIVTVRDVTKPNAVVQVEDKQIFIENPIYFDGGSSTDNVNVTYFEWNLGDGTIAKEKKVLHRYLASGVYNVTLTVTDENGNTDTDWIEVTVNPSWGSNIFLLLIIIVFIVAIIYAAYHIFFITPKPKREIYKME